MKKIVSLLLCMMLLVGLCFALASCQCKHEYGDPVVTEATCTEAGYETYTCTKCGETKVENPESLAAKGHTKDEGTVTTPPTCTEAGVKTFKCTVCEATIDTETVAAIGHDYKINKTATKHSEICANCQDAKVAETDHTYGEQTVVTEATCTEDGAATKTCTFCEYVANVVLPAKGHTTSGDPIVTQPTAGNCKPGMTYKVCSVCNENVVTEWRPSDMAHKFVVDTTALSEEDHTGSHNGAIGKITYKCTVCETKYVVDATWAYDFNNDCLCGYDYCVANVSAETNIKAEVVNGYFSFTGTVVPPNVVQNQQMYVATPAQLDGQSTLVMGVSFSMPEAGFPEMGLEFISKLSGWKNPKETIFIDKDGVIKCGGEVVGQLTVGKFTNIVVSMEIAEEANADGKYPVEVNYWIDGAWIKTTETSEPMGAATFSNDGNSYVQWKIAQNAANVDPNRGVLMDNIFLAYELPDGFVKSAAAKHTCEAETGAALQYNANGHYNVCKICGEPMTVTAHTLGESTTVAPEAGKCAPGMTYQACDCGYKKVTNLDTTVSDTPHTFIVDTSALAAVDHAGVHSAVPGKITYTCTECGASYTVEAVAAVTFDDCSCNFKYDVGNSILTGEAVGEGRTEVAVSKDGELSIIGAMSWIDADSNGAWDSTKDQKGTMNNNLDMRLSGDYSPVYGKLTDAQVMVVGFTVTMPEAGFPEWGASLNLKYNGAWSNSDMRLQDGKVSFAGNSVTLTAGVPVNIVAMADAKTAGKIIWNIWVDGLWMGQKEVACDKATATNTFETDLLNNYMNLTISANNVANVDPNRGIILDNVFWSNAIPEGFVAAKFVAPTPAQ